MISLETKIDLLGRLKEYMLSDNEAWQLAQQTALQHNGWFTPGQITLAIENIAGQFLQKELLVAWIGHYSLPETAKTVGIVMAGNIPLVGFHDFLCGFMSGHRLMLKLSSKDDVLLDHLIGKLIAWAPELTGYIAIAGRLNGCDAYIATGSNNTARYFEQYFGKYPHIIRKNRTSVAVLDGHETTEQLEALADDAFQYFGLGCRNVSQVYVPEGYDFAALLQAFSKYDVLMEHHKYKNNYDYYLAIYLLNRVPYITNGSVLLVENSLPFSAVSVMHYSYYTDKIALMHDLNNSEDIQTIVATDFVPFGTSQRPALSDYADGADTMAFLCSL